MAQFAYPTNHELIQIAQEKLPKLTQDDMIFKYFPIVSRNMNNVMFTQRDNYTGLQQWRGVGGEPNRVQRKGAKRYLYEPGVYGEFIRLDEKEILERAPWSSYSGFMDLSEMVMEAQDQLLGRRVDRIRWILYTLLTTGAFYVPAETNAANSTAATQGNAGHGDAYANVTAIGQFGMQTFTASPTWATVATATPLADFRNMQIAAERGRSVSLGRNADAIMNRSTFYNMVGNTNPNDLGGQTKDLSPSNLVTQEDVNKILLAADLPQVVINDDGYIDDNGVFQLWIPNNTVMVVGSRTDGASLGEYIMTRNVNNDGMAPGPYQFVNDFGLVPNAKKVPRSIEIHDGHNGGPALWYPSALVRMTV